jgi:hypothetical protein
MMIRMFQRFSFEADPVKQPGESEPATEPATNGGPTLGGPEVSDINTGMQSLSIQAGTPLDSSPPQPLQEYPHAKPKSSPKSGNRRFSFRPFGFRHSLDGHKQALSTDQEHHKRELAADAKLAPHKPVSTSAQKRAKESAIIVRALIVGPIADPLAPQVTRAVAAPQLSKVKAQLMQPIAANRVIAELRALPVSDRTLVGGEGKDSVGEKPSGPIHAVCLEYTESDAHEKHFSKVAMKLTTTDENAVEVASETIGFPSVSSASIEVIATMLGNMHVVSLIGPPDFGLGQPAGGKGILAGALPTAKTVMNGVVQITPQLMALGYTTGMSIAPDHHGEFYLSKLVRSF